MKMLVRVKGSPKSGHRGHAGRPGKRGGSAPKSSGGLSMFMPGAERDTRREKGIYDVISETDEDTAKILLTQGVEPSFKPLIAEVMEFRPGRGIERDGLYVANDEAFSKGSFGGVRLYMTTNKDNLKSPREMTQLGRSDIDDVLGTENGAVTSGALGRSEFVAVEVYKDGSWHRMLPVDYLQSLGVASNTPKLPTVGRMRGWVEKNANVLFLSKTQVENFVFDYNRASLEDKLWMAEEAGFL